MTSIRLKIEESWYASMDCKVQKSGPWVCFYGGHSTGYKLGNHPKNIEPCAHRARTVRAPCAHRATTPPMALLSALSYTSVASHELSDEGLRFSSDGEELFSTDVSDRPLGGSFLSDSDGFSTDVSDTRRKR